MLMHLCIRNNIITYITLYTELIESKRKEISRDIVLETKSNGDHMLQSFSTAKQASWHIRSRTSLDIFNANFVHVAF